jgi:GrpE
VNRPGGGRPVSGSWTPLLLGALVAAAVGVVVVWFLIPRTPDAFSSAGNALAAKNALPAGSHGSSSAGGLPVFTSFGSAGSFPPSPSAVPSTPPAEPSTLIPGTVIPETAVPSPAPLSPSPSKSHRSRRPSTGPTVQQDSQDSVPFVLAVTPSGTASASFPADAIGRDVAKAYGYSPTIAVEVGKGDSFAVAPVADPGRPSAVPVLVAAALLGALACLTGALLRRRTRWEPAPATGGGQVRGDAPAAGVGQATWGGQAATPVRPLPPGTEPIAGTELRQLRRSAEQKTALARSVAELVPSLPDALVWRAEQALADVGVRSVVPDGQLFDAEAHHVVGTEPVPRGGRENTIARTIRPGYADGETILVYPKVIVYADDTDGRTR